MNAIKETASSAPREMQRETREMPPIPGGGSWRFNEADWKWESNNPIDPAAQPAEVKPAAQE